MDWRELAVKTAERITDDNWIQGVWWYTTEGSRMVASNRIFYDHQSVPNRLFSDPERPVKACGLGHIYWTAQEHGLSFDDAKAAAKKIVRSVRNQNLRMFTRWNDQPGRTAAEVAECISEAAACR